MEDVSSTAPTDVLGLLGAALQAQDADVQARHLRQLLLVFQAQPGNIPPLIPNIVPMLLERTSETLKRWIVDVIDLTFCKPTLGPQARSALAYHMPEPLLTLLNEPDLRYAKVAIMAFASVYQPLFRLVCTDQTQARLWPTIQTIKERIVQLFELPHRMDIKLVAIKAFQKIILVQSRGNDARSQQANRSSADVNIAQIPPDHPILRLGPLEQEANDRLKQIVTIVFVSANPDLVMASMNSMALLAKMRPTLSPIVFEALVSWTPSALVSLPYVTVRSVEKTLKLLFQHFHPSRNSLAGPYASQIIEAFDNQKLRMETAAREEEARRLREGPMVPPKRPALGTSSAGGASKSASSSKRKRVRFAEVDDEETVQVYASPPVQQDSSPTAGVGTADEIASAADDPSLQSQGDPLMLADPSTSATNPMASFDATSIPLPLVIDLIMANLEVIGEAELERTIAQARARINGEAAIPFVASELRGKGQGMEEDEEEEEELAQDPLKLDMGEEETLNAAERQLEEHAAHDGEEGVGQEITSFELKPPSVLGTEDCNALMHASVNRICLAGAKESADSAAVVGNDPEASPATATMHSHLWTILITRLATRGFGHFDLLEDQEGDASADSQLTLRSQSDAVRELMLDFVSSDFPTRHVFALQWMAEEFHCHVIHRKQGRLGEDQSSPYTIWLQRITAAVIEKMDSKDKTLHDFLHRVPLLTEAIITSLQSLCLDKTKMAAGFTMLRDLAIHRIPVRPMIGQILLGLTRNGEKLIRGAAIITVRNWVRVNGQGASPAGELLERDVLEYAKVGLRRLTVHDEEKSTSNGAHKKTDEGPKGESKEQNGHIEDADKMETETEGNNEVSALDDAQKEIRLDSDVVRLVELPFALCVRVSDMLDEIFLAYASMPKQVQEAVVTHIKPLIQNLGANNAKLLSLIQHHPAGTDSLAVRVFNILGERNRSKKLVELAKQMAEERTNEIDPRFLIPILPDLEKAEIIKYLPRVVSILSSEKAEDRTMLKNVFTSVVQPPEQGFGSVSTNLPRVRQSELLSSVELMCLLHDAEPEIGRKTAADAIRICFGMTEIFNSEVIGAVLNRLIEEPVLPVLFMRTAIIAVRTYKSLSSYISTIFLSRLITKKVWQQPVLWDGFKICAKQTAPASFGALIQLPREQLRDVVTRQPELRTGLREYLVKKAGGNKARLKSFLESLGEEDEDGNTSTPSIPTALDRGGGGGGQTPGSGTSTPLHVATPADAST